MGEEGEREEGGRGKRWQLQEVSVAEGKGRGLGGGGRCAPLFPTLGSMDTFGQESEDGAGFRFSDCDVHQPSVPLKQLV